MIGIIILYFISHPHLFSPFLLFNILYTHNIPKRIYTTATAPTTGAPGIKGKFHFAHGISRQNYNFDSILGDSSLFG